MSMLASTHRPGDRLPELCPFELEPALGQEPKGSPQAPMPLAGSAYGCVEWFQYLDHPAATPAAPPRSRAGLDPDTAV